MAARAATSPPKLPIYIVWNFFPPMPPSADFPTFVGGWRTKASVVRTNPGFLVTQLHRNLDPKGKFPYVNHASFDSPDFHVFSGVPPAGRMVAGGAGGAGDAGGADKGQGSGGPPSQGSTDQQRRPQGPRSAVGGYAEHVTSTGSSLSPWMPVNKDSVWILTGFKIDQSNSAEAKSFETNWMSQSGAEFILNNSPKDFGVSKVAFYKKFTAFPPGGMEYVLRAEIPTVGENLDAAWAFLEQLRAFKYPSYITSTDISLYKTDEENILFPEEGRKALPEGHSWQDE